MHPQCVGLLQEKKAYCVSNHDAIVQWTFYDVLISNEVSVCGYSHYYPRIHKDSYNAVTDYYGDLLLSCICSS